HVRPARGFDHRRMLLAHPFQQQPPGRLARRGIVPGWMPSRASARSVPDIELSIVVPVYNEAGNVPEFLGRLLPILREHVRSYEVVFAADPSRDGTEGVIRRLREDDPAIKLIVFS